MKFLAIAWKSSVFPFQVVTESQRSINRTSTGDRPQPPRRHPPPPATPPLDSPGPAGAPSQPRKAKSGQGGGPTAPTPRSGEPSACGPGEKREGGGTARGGGGVGVVGDDVAPRDAKNSPRLAFFSAGREPSLPRSPCLAFLLPTCLFLHPPVFSRCFSSLPRPRLRNKNSRLRSRARTPPSAPSPRSSEAQRPCAFERCSSRSALLEFATPFLLAIPLPLETRASLSCAGAGEGAILPAALFVLGLPDPIFRKLLILSPGMIGSPLLAAWSDPSTRERPALFRCLVVPRNSCFCC